MLEIQQISLELPLGCLERDFQITPLSLKDIFFIMVTRMQTWEACSGHVTGRRPAGPEFPPLLVSTAARDVPASCAGKKPSKMADTLGLLSAKLTLRGPALYSSRTMGASLSGVRKMEKKKRFIRHCVIFLTSVQNRGKMENELFSLLFFKF